MTKDNTLYTEKTPGYFSTIRYELIREIPVGTVSVLEIGCGQGDTGAVLKREGRAQWVAGVELSDDAAQKAALVLDKVITGNIERIEMPFQDGQFDAIILGDVLEHLVDPWYQVKRLARYLSQEGFIVASIPNVRNWRVVIPLLFFGRWEYADSGITDRTHLRFFTKSGIIGLFELNGFEIKKLLPIGRRSSRVARLPIGFLRDFITSQYLVVCKRKNKEP
jgi:SAM-dependent methyltransferase